MVLEADHLTARTRTPHQTRPIKSHARGSQERFRYSTGEIDIPNPISNACMLLEAGIKAQYQDTESCKLIWERLETGRTGEAMLPPVLNIKTPYRACLAHLDYD
jgi:hypothetical protein